MIGAGSATSIMIRYAATGSLCVVIPGVIVEVRMGSKRGRGEGREGGRKGAERDGPWLVRGTPEIKFGVGCDRTLIQSLLSW